uniref:Uncharacterized protein n=1 Tax=Streptomyces sp. NBC_00049 TaxID=2903617 RepID=A0AAU2K0G9_9ACTN
MGELRSVAETDQQDTQPAQELPESSEGDDFDESVEPEAFDDTSELPYDEGDYREPDEPEDTTDDTARFPRARSDREQPTSPEEADPVEPEAALPQAEGDVVEPDGRVGSADDNLDPEPEPEPEPEPNALGEPEGAGLESEPQEPAHADSPENPENTESGTAVEDEAGSHGEASAEVSDEVRLAQAEAEGQEIGELHGVQVDYTTNPMSPDSANDVNQAMEKLSAEYPDVFGNLEVVQSEAAGEDSVLAYAVLEPGGEEPVGIYLDSGDLADHDALSEQGKLEEETNWTVPGGGSVEGIFHHEFGHHLAQHVFDSPEANEELESVVSNAIGRPYDTSVEPHDEETAEAIESLVSEYGATDPHEMVAECFAEYKLAEDPRPFATEVGQIIDKYLKSTKE